MGSSPACCRQIVERFETQTHSQQPEAVVHVEALPLSRTFTVSCTATRLCSRKGEEEEKEEEEEMWEEMEEEHIIGGCTSRQTRFLRGNQ